MPVVSRAKMLAADSLSPEGCKVAWIGAARVGVWRISSAACCACKTRLVVLSFFLLNADPAAAGGNGELDESAETKPTN